MINLFELSFIFDYSEQIGIEQSKTFEVQKFSHGKFNWNVALVNQVHCYRDWIYKLIQTK